MKNIKWGILRMAGGVVSATIAIYGAWLTGRVIEIAMSGDKSQFWSYLIVLIIATVVRSVVSYLNPNASQRYGFLNGKTFRKLTLEKITRLPINYYENKHTGDTISKFIVDIERLQWFSTNAMASIWSYVPTLLIISTIYLVKLNALLMLICCACIPLISYIIGKISIPISDTSKIIQTKKSEYNSYLRDFLEGIHI
ncbi:MAG: ABC transporter ATP-binding protein, partial [Clostridiales bacterium]|nr:ABC transporter ATP-binding protein [Clostridiales bacterium]